MGTVIIGAIVFTIIGLAAYHTMKPRRNEGCGGGCGCGGCSGCGTSKPEDAW